MIEQNNKRHYYSRFSLGQRFLHGTIMVTFLGLALTGMVLRFSRAGWAEWFATTVGGFSAILFWHKACAVILSTAFLIHLGHVLYRGLVKREKGIFWGPDSMVPNLKDLKDIYHHFRWFFWRGPRPDFDHFAYWEKFDYWAVFWGMGIIGFSGYVMWFATFFARFLPGSWLNIALLIHGEEALLAVWFIFAIHFFNTHLRPESFPMDLVIFTGTETEAELKEKRRQEYQRLLEMDQLQARQTPAPTRWLKNFGRTLGAVVIVVGFVLLCLTVTAFVRGQ
jgi:cytochrome b subunit of formate dehydrogenase